MDPISNMFVIIRNALSNKEKQALVPFSKVKKQILEILRNENYIGTIEETDLTGKKYLKVSLKYENKFPAIEKIKRISKPGLRIYSSCKDIPKPLQGTGTVVISTNKGIMDGNTAKRLKIGGEIICEIY